MSNPKARHGVLRGLSSPAAVMVVTAAAVFFSLADHRIEPAAVASAAPPPAIEIASQSDSVVAKPRDRIVVASIRPQQRLLDSVLMHRTATSSTPPHSSVANVAIDADVGRQIADNSHAAASSSAADTATDASTFRWRLSEPTVGPPEPLAAVEAENTPPVEVVAKPDSAVEPAAEVATKPEPEIAVVSSAKPKRTLPFDPLQEPALTGSRGDSLSPAKGLEALIVSDEVHTARAVREVPHKVKPGEAFSTVLERHGCGPKEAARWLDAVREHHNPNRIYAGQTINLLLDMPEQRLRRITIDLGHGDSLVVEDTGSELAARKKTAPSETTVRVVEGDISSSLYEVAIGKGVPDRVISDAAEVLGWEINLGRDLQPGARFRLAYEQTLRLDTREATSGRLLAVELLNSGKHYEGFYFQSSDGKTAGYYNRKGDGLGRAFLRYPVSFSRISSKFSTARYHPVLKKSRPHYGVDFAAPTGTPVKAVADGTVTLAGWHGGNGRFVKIRHDKQYESGYAHLSRIASGLRSGSRVKQGQVIGYVGSTGLATGPHLHFAMYSNGKYIDPLHASLPRTTPLSASTLASFRAQLSRVDGVYASNGMTAFGANRPATAAAPAAGSKSR